MQIPLLSGVIAGSAAEFIQRPPLNLEAVPVDSKINKGQLRAAAGAISKATGPGEDRGGIVWNGTHYRVMGTKLITVGADWSITTLGDVGEGKRCRLDYSFDRLIIVSGERLYYFDGTVLAQVTDEDLGVVVDAMWIDGYTMTTDGTYVLVTELNDPTSVQPLKYGSAESDPDPVTGLLRYREEAYVLGRYTIQTFRNVGGTGFPFATVKGGTIPFGCIGPFAKCLLGDGFAFVGSARDEALNVYVGGQGSARAFGSKALCKALSAVEDQTAIELEARGYGAEQRLLIHLPTESWCFLVNASQAFGEPVWYRLEGSDGAYCLRNSVEVDGVRIVACPFSGKLGELTETDARHFGNDVPWQFEVGMLANDGLPFVMDSVELIGLPGRGQGSGSIFLSMTRDGETWTGERALTVNIGERTKRLQWRPHCRISNYMGLRFRGAGAALPGIAAVEVKARPLGASQ